MTRPWLAIDPSFRNTGWAIMNDGYILQVGLIATARGDGPIYLDNARCVEHLACGLYDVLDIAERKCSVGAVYCEAKGGSKSSRAAVAMAMSAAITQSCVAIKGLELVLMQAQTVKKMLTGNRSASKDDIRAAVKARYGDAEEVIEEAGYKAKKYNEHIYDAIAIGWAINKERTR